MSPDAIMPAAIDKVTQRTFCNRFSVNERFIVSIQLPAYTITFTNMLDGLSIQTRCDASFSPSDNSEKLVRSSAVKLLMRLRLRGDETHHCQKLCEELCAEMPPGVPDKILRCRYETTDRRALQVRMDFIHDDECLCSLCALLDDPKRIAAME